MTDLPRVDRIIRSRRKTVALLVTADGQLEIHAPQQITRGEINTILTDKAGWIRKQQEAALRLAEQFHRRDLVSGARVWYLGGSYPVDIVRTRSNKVQFSDSILLSLTDPTQAEKILIGWYKVQARRILNQIVQQFAHTCGFRYQSVRITSARTRWGSCSRKNALSFPWRLVMAPREMIDYVVVHELAHTVEKNHSPSFWTLVERFIPDYRHRQAWFRLNGRLLDPGIDANENTLQIPRIHR